MKMKPVEVKSSTYIHNKNPKFEVGYHERISKSKTISAKGYTPNWSGDVFWLK